MLNQATPEPPTPPAEPLENPLAPAMADPHTQLRAVNIGTETEVYLKQQGTRPTSFSTKKLSNGRYLNTDTGELIQTDARKSRRSEMKSIRDTITRMRHLADLNFDGSDNEKFITLTYNAYNAKNRILTPPTPDMAQSDIEANKVAEKGIKDDFRRFIRKVRAKYQDNAHKLQFIQVVQPHDTGQCHIHMILKRLNSTSFNPSNDDLNAMWGLGNVTSEPVKHVKSVGAYISAGMLNNDRDPKHPNRSTHYERLKYYPAGMRLFSTSRGLVQPKTETVTVQDLKERGLDLDTPVFVSTKRHNVTNGQVYVHHHVFYDNNKSA